MTELSDFKKAGFLAGSNANRAQEILDGLRPQFVRFVGGEDLCHPERPETRLWVIIGGLVIVKELADGRLREITVRGPGTVIGELGFFGIPGGARTAVVTVATPVEAWEVRYDNIRNLSSLHQAEFFRDLGRVVASKLAETTVQSASLTARSAADLELLRMFVPQFGLSFNERLRLLEGVKVNYEQHRLAILFSDIVGFSDITAQISPDDTAEFVRGFLDKQVKAILDEGGEIDKFIGDAVMAWWLIDNEESQRDICASAFTAACHAIEEVKLLPNPAVPENHIEIRIGLHVGSAYIGNYGSQTRSAFTVIGNDVNIAARLEQARDPATGDPPLGSLRVSEDMAKQLGKH